MTADRAWRFAPTKPAWMQEGTYEFENNVGAVQRRAVGHATRPLLVGARPAAPRATASARRTSGTGRTSRSRCRARAREYSTYAFELFASHAVVGAAAVRHRRRVRRHRARPRRRGARGASSTTSPRRSRPTASGCSPTCRSRSRASGRSPSTCRRCPARLGPAGSIRRPATTSPSPTAYEYDERGTRDVHDARATRDDGTDDWLLVLDSSGMARCGSITTSGVYTPPDVTPRGSPAR